MYKEKHRHGIYKFWLWKAANFGNPTEKENKNNKPSTSLKEQ